MGIKAIATDYDWTLTNGKGVVAPMAVEAIRRAKSLGVPVIIATARTLINIQDKIRKIDLRTTGPIIAENGGVIKDQITGKEVVLGSLEKAEKAYDVIRRHVKGLKRLPPMNLPHHTIRQTDIVLIVRKEAIEAVRQVISENKLDVDFTYAPSPHSPGRTAVFIKDPRANKGAGLKVAAKMMGIEPKEVAAIGDSENDLEMFEISGFSIAVGNADEKLKEKANLVVGGRYGEGVAEAFDYILRNLI